MSKHIEMIQKILNLSETGMEALNHIKSQLHQNQFEDTFSLMSDVVHAFSAIEESLNAINSEEVNLEEALLKSDKLKQSLEITVTAFENHNSEKVKEILQFNLMPAYQHWRNELETVLRPHILH